MADQSSKLADKPRSPLKTKVVKSQKIQAVSPTDPKTPAPDDEEYEARDRAATLPRSHTPGHLASKSQDRRRKPSDLSIRQRSQSSVVSPSAPLSSATSITGGSKTPGPSPAVLSARLQQTNGETASDNQARDRGDSSAAEGSGSGTNRRPTALRSTSAIVAKSGSTPTGPGASSVQSTGSRHASHTRSHQPKGAHIPFPPLIDPRTAPDVLPAPSSGMYWSRAQVSGCPHPALRAHTTTLIGSNVFVFGGCDSRACFNELYVLDADSFYWSKPHVVGEIPVPLRAMTCTAVGKKLVIFGGGDGPAYYNDVYVLDTVNYRWSRPRMSGDKVPSKRRAHTACLYKNGIYVFGGGDGVRALNDIWRLDVTDVTKMSWKLISGPSSSSSADKSPASGKDLRPKARGYHTANMVGGKLIIFGGSDGGECFNDVWVYDVDAHLWRAVHIPVTYRRLSHTATIVGSYLFVIGGHDGNEYSNDVLLLNLVTMTWDRRRIYGIPPSGRGYHGIVLYDSRLLMIGGFDGTEVFGDVWLLELAIHAYYSQISHFTIEV
jgi:hypothetical protein